MTCLMNMFCSLGISSVMNRRCVIVGSLLAAVVLCALVAVLVLRPWASEEHRRYRRAVVAANGIECAAIGRGILEKGGSAVDAAIATLFCEGVGCAQCMGLGGGFLATVYDASTRQVRVLNARERAPAAAYAEMYQNASSTVGGLAVAVPGELRGYGALHEKFGHLEWRELVKPTAELCRKGHRVSEYQGRVLDSYSNVIHEQPSMRELYVNPETGEVYKEGDLIKDPLFAQTLDRIAEEGPEAIHNGSMTASLARDIQGFGGIVTEDDLRNYRVEWQDPITVELSPERTLYTVPLPGSGSVLAYILNILKGWVGTGTDVEAYSGLYWHRIMETFKYAYAKRTGLGDPTRVHSPINIRELQSNLTSESWALTYRSLIDDTRTYNDWRHYGALFEGADDHGTAQVSVVAPDGSAVSVTSTINYIWGAQRRSPSLGFMLNNEMDDFAVPDQVNSYGMPPSPSNMIEPGIQPLSSMVPSIVVNKDGHPDLVIGAAGGTKITTQISLVVMQTLYEKEEYSPVIRRPRLHHQLVPMHIEHEANVDPELLKSLQARGHETTQLGPTAGFAAIVGTLRGPDGFWQTQTDPRRVGSIDGL
ncbi:glutathione hydrolase 1 proenzyme-like isoform X2 [Aricia agestis]|uniref:glutathione hydrolase 1 proenzyme-like isoform X2 n=1 Tax=Aricia agestis TaxID=91739 RepID=UPI001C206C9B|nr:glutathione hydrolase 1 proenzyme-like isoform X2 [Aricia agestis]